MQANTSAATAFIKLSLYARAVLMDSGAFVALANPADQHYAAASACLAEIVARRPPVVVPMPVVFESYRRICT